MDSTTLVLAVDSTQVNSAATALDKMADSGTKAEKSIESLKKTYNQFRSERLAGAKQEVIDLGIPKAEQHAAAMKKINAEWAEYKKTGNDAVRSVALSWEEFRRMRSGPLFDEATKGGASKTSVAADVSKRIGAEWTAYKQGGVEALKAVQQAQGGVLQGAQQQAAAQQAATNAVQQQANAAQTAARATQQGVAAANQLVTAEQKAAQAAKLRADMEKRAADNAVQAAKRRAEMEAQMAILRARSASAGQAIGSTAGNVARTAARGGDVGGVVADAAADAAVALFPKLGLLYGSLAVAVGVLALAYEKGQRDIAAFNSAAQASGNAAGITLGQFNDMTKQVSKNTGEAIDKVRELGNALQRTGELGPQNFTAALRAAPGFANVTGASPDATASTFAGIARDPARAFEELNRKHNFANSPRLRQTIEELQDAGDKAAAANLVFDVLAQRFDSVTRNLTPMQNALHSATNAWKKFWDAAADEVSPRAATPEARVARLETKLKQFDLGNLPTVGQIFGGQTRHTSREQIENELKEARRDQFRSGEIAAGDGIKTDINRRADDAFKEINRTLEKRKTSTGLEEAMATARRQVVEARAGGIQLSEKDEKIFLDKKRREFEQKGPRGGGEAGQVARRKLQQDLGVIGATLENQKDVLQHEQQLIEADYNAGIVSFEAYFAERQRVITEGSEKEVAALQATRARLKTELANEKDPSTKIELQTRIDKTEIDEKNVVRETTQATEVLNKTKTASYERLTEQVEQYRVQLLRMAGDEVGAEKLRQAQELKRVTQVATQTGRPDLVPAFEQAQQVEQRKLEQRNATTAVTARLSLEEARLTAQLRTGALGEMEALHQLGAARARAVADMEAVVAAKEELAAAFPLNLQLQIDTARARQELEDLKGSVDALADRFRGMFQNAGANALSGIMEGRFAQPDEAGLDRKRRDLDRGHSAQSSRIMNDRTLTEVRRRKAMSKLNAETTAAEKGLKAERPGAVDQVKGALIEFSKGIAAEINGVVAKELTAKLFAKDGPLGSVFGMVAEMFGGKRAVVDPTVVAQASMTRFATAGVDPTTVAMGRLQVAVDAAVAALNKVPGAGGATPAFAAPTTGDFVRLDRGQVPGAAPTTGDFARMDRAGTTDALQETTTAATTAAAAGTELAKASALGTQAITLLTSASADAAKALGPLPMIMQMIEASAGSGGGGTGSMIGKLAGLAMSYFGGAGAGMAGLGSVNPVSGEFMGSLEFAKGGYTGDVDPKKPTGIVHGKEFVFSAPAVKTLGKDVLHVLHDAAKEGDGDAVYSALESLPKPSGNRVLGGPVAAGQTYRVNEEGPELLQVGDKNYLMMGGGKGGEVKPLPSGQDGSTIVNVNVTPPAGSTRETAMQWGSVAGRQLQHSIRRNG